MKYQEINNFINDNPEIVHDFIDLFCGDYIGSGTTRSVYVFRYDPEWVIKIENENACGDNWTEWRIWGTVKHTTDGTKEWFAECSWISTNGKVLLQKRTKPLMSKPNKIPDKIPSWFTDLKEDNFGWIGNNLVCHDYSLCVERFGYFALKPNKLQKFKYNEY